MIRTIDRDKAAEGYAVLADLLLNGGQIVIRLPGKSDKTIRSVEELAIATEAMIQSRNAFRRRN